MIHNKKILLVDDDQLNNLINTRIITKFSDYTVDSFTSAKAGLMYLHDCEPELFPEIIFLDINMPRYSGFDCYALLKKDSRFMHTRFVFLSTTINEKDIPPGCDSMVKQHSLKTYEMVLKKLLRTPFNCNSSQDTSLSFDLCQPSRTTVATY